MGKAAKTRQELLEELEEKDQLIAKLQEKEAESSTAQDELLANESWYKTLLDALPQKIFFKDRNSVWITSNENMARDLGGTPADLAGKTDYDFWPRELADKYGADDRRLMESGKTEEIEEKYVQDGEEFWVNTVKTPVRDGQGEVTGILGIFWDITERKQAEEELQQHRDHLEEMVQERTTQLQQEIAEGKRREEVIRNQTEEILELSTPVIQVWDGVVVAPLIGTLDSQRTARFMEVLLERIVETNSPVALVDITGVPTIDTQTAQNLVETISAVRLLGAQVILTGVRPAIAQTLVHLGIDLSDVDTRASLAAGLRLALEHLDR